MNPYYTYSITVLNIYCSWFLSLKLQPGGLEPYRIYSFIPDTVPGKHITGVHFLTGSSKFRGISYIERDVEMLLHVVLNGRKLMSPVHNLKFEIYQKKSLTAFL